MTEEELAAAVIAIEAVLRLQPSPDKLGMTTTESRWKMAGRLPDVEMEDLRALY